MGLREVREVGRLLDCRTDDERGGFDKPQHGALEFDM